MKKKFKILFLDTNPLITLDTINRLDLFTLPKMDIYITDAVKYEFLYHEYINHDKIEDFFTNYVNIKSTELGISFEKALIKSALNNTPFDFKPYRDLGERTMLDFLSNPNEDTSKYLIITDDYKALLLFSKASDEIRTFNCIETSTFLKILEKDKLIKSADDIIQKIEEAGRNFRLKKDTSKISLRENISFSMEA